MSNHSHKILDAFLLVLSLLLSLSILASLVQLVVGGDILQSFYLVSTNVISIIVVLTIILIIIILVFENSSPVHTLAWIMVLIFVPVVGIIFYLLFGRNWRKIKLFRRKEIFDKELFAKISNLIPGYSGAELKPHLEHKLHHLLKNNSKAILSHRNKIRLFSETPQAFDSICAAIETARHHVHLEYFSIAADSTGRYLQELLIRKAGQGVTIRFIYDDVACWRLPRSFKHQLRRAGVRFVPFMPVWIPFLNSRMNYRNHRKLVIVDGKTAFLGGLNIGDQYLGKDPYYGYWRDSVASFEGEAVLSMQAIFLGDWFFVSRENLFETDALDQYFNCDGIQDISHQNAVQVVASGPDTDQANILQLYFSAIANAQKQIRITTPYLILNEALLMALKTAAISGVQVQIILPGKADHFVVYWGSRSYIQELLEAGVEIFEYTKGFIHAKILIVDQEVLGLGTANMDLRSFNHNFELTALVYEDAIVAQASLAFEEDLLSSRQLLLESFARRSIAQRSKESLCRLFSPLL